MEKSREILGGGSGGISNIIYRVRGKEVMLDADLAKIYGYTTKALNQQVKNNMEKFEGEEFMFQLTREEVDNLLKSQIVTLNEMGDCSRSNFLTLNLKKQGSNIKYLPYAFTEQGVYMLMTVLKGIWRRRWRGR